MEIDSGKIKSVPATFRDVAKSRGSQIALRYKEFGIWQEVSWNDYYLQSTYLAHALIKLGIQQGDFIGIIGENCPEWLFMDMGIQMAGARAVGIYTTNSWKQVQYILEHSECKILFAENEEQVDKWLHIKDKLPSLEYIICWDKKGLNTLEEPQLIYYDHFIETGKESFNSNPDLHHSRIDEVDPNDIAILVYTSGTTGQPKGAELTSINLLWVAENLKHNTNTLIHDNDRTMSFLPLCHIFERMFSVYLPLSIAYIVHFAESIDTISQNIREIRPSIGYAVPRVWEKFQSNILIKMGDAPRLNRFLFKTAIKIGRSYTEKKLAQKPVGLILRLQRFIVFWTVLYPLKYMMGMNRMRVALSGAAPISPKVLEFYHMLDIPLIEGYGMTETSAIITISTIDDFKLGTVGKLLEGAELKLDEEGEILVKHPGVIKGYYKNPEATARSIHNGWLHTGDIGEFDEDGFLKIVDRKKDLIITAGGKNIAPQKLENKLKVSPYINDAIVIGDKRKYLTAIIILDEENINKFSRDQKLQYSTYSELTTNSEIRKLIDGVVKQVNSEVSQVETLKKFTILDKRLYVEDGEVTPTMKVKRKFINEEYHELIEKMYIYKD